jgi:hypothetical protein
VSGDPLEPQRFREQLTRLGRFDPFARACLAWHRRTGRDWRSDRENQEEKPDQQ